MMRGWILLVGASWLFPCGVIAQTAPGQPSQRSAPNASDGDQQEDTGLADIVVTAQRRSESLQRAAVAVSAISGDALRDAGLSRPAELTALVPALQVSVASGPYSNFYLRGVGNYNINALSDPAVAFNFGGVFIGRPSSVTGFFYDLDRVEVLKGPQGTLYGRNATGGAINVLPRQAKLGETGASASIEFSNYEGRRLDAAVNLPLGQSAAVRLAGVVVTHDGYMNGGTDDQKDHGVRGSVTIEPSSDVRITIVSDYFHQGGRGAGSTPVALDRDRRIGVTSPEGRDYYRTQPNTLLGRLFRGYPAAEFQDNDFYGASSTFEWTTVAGTVTVVPAYRQADVNYRTYAVGYRIDSKERDKQTSVEARYASPEDLNVRLLLGGFYFRETNGVDYYNVNNEGNAAYQQYGTGTTSRAAFGRLTYEVAQTIRLNAGARYTSESKSFGGSRTAINLICTRSSIYSPAYVPGCPNAGLIPAEAISAPPYPDFSLRPTVGTILTGSQQQPDNEASFKRWTYRVGGDVDLTPRSLLFASVETGFKSGGFFFSNDPGVFQPERITAFTLGSKNRFLAGRVQVNVEAFHWKYKDQQISHVSYDSTNAVIFATENIGASTSKGVEVELQYLLLEDILLTGDVQYLDARYDRFQYTIPNQNGGAGTNTACAIASVTASAYTLDCSGFRPPQSPRWSVNLGLQQGFALRDGKIVLDLRGHYQTRTLTGLEFTRPEIQRAYATFDAALKFKSVEKFTFGIFVNNIFDKAVLASTTPVPFSNFLVSTLRPPRVFGLRAGLNL